MTADLRLGRWQDVLADVEVDTLLTDPPYGARTHEGHNAMEEATVSITGQATREAINYSSFTDTDVFELVRSWAPRTRGWMCCMTSHDLIGAYETAYLEAGRMAFAPVPIIQKRPRLIGDGPSSWAVYLMVSRPRSVTYSRWGCLPGAYDAPTARKTGIAGAKPVSLMERLVRDYSRLGDLVCDPFAGTASTATAAMAEMRLFVGAEADAKHHAIAMKRLARGHTPNMFAGVT